MTYFVWALIALVLGLAMVMLEVFVPSAGILGFLAFSLLITSVVFAFLHSPMMGAIFLTTVMIGLPFVFLIAIQWFPYTPVGRRILLRTPTLEDEESNEDPSGLNALMGKIGRARSVMLPSGAVTIDGKTIDAVSAGMTIEQGQLVEVIEVRGNRVVVCPIEEEVNREWAEDSDEPFSEDSNQNTGLDTSSEPDLNQSIDSLGLDSLDNPLR
ncbi:NfeD domain-containing protein [Planctomycetales bacterium 10988]|nr:NfeD domain-containing protein [Planctomycetales bacterium 10988]